jgi:hypothetical protein
MRRSRAMPTVNVLITLDDTGSTTSSNKITITVDPEPLIMGNNTSEEEVDIVWTLETTLAPSWLFAPKGVVLKGPGVHFTDNHVSPDGKSYSWKRKKRNSKGFKYTVNVVNVSNGSTMTLDPKIYNN